tara:strand:- start:6970 stop:7356 length:387 start_codon:yes stop_codon:yes gene_type:complete
MIKYKLICKSCSNDFESWFASSKEFERLKKSKFLNCLSCNSHKVEKSMMAPSIINKQKKSNSESKKLLEIKNKLKEYKKFIKNNFEYVGDNFAYEARSIHYNKKKKKKEFMAKYQQKKLKSFLMKELK